MMGVVEIHAVLLGDMMFEAEAGFFEFCSIELSEAEVSFPLLITEDVFGNGFVAPRADSEIYVVETVERFLDNIPLMCVKSIEAARLNFSSELIADFAEFHLAAYGEESLSPLFPFRNVGTLTADIFADTLTLGGVMVGRNQAGSLECAIDLTLGEVFLEEMLVFYFDELLEISWMTAENNAPEGGTE
jgi:hypothetical protein